MGPRTRRAVAAHAAARCLVSALLDGCDELQKVHLFPGGEPAYVAFFLPSEESVDFGARSAEELRGDLVGRMAGRAATAMLGLPDGGGAAAGAPDLAAAGALARELVLSLGASASLGGVSYMAAPREAFLASDATSELARLQDMSPAVASAAFVECAALLEAAQAGAAYALALNWGPFTALLAALQQRRVMRGPEVSALLQEQGAVRLSLQGLERAQVEPATGTVAYPTPVHGAPQARLEPLHPGAVLPEPLLEHTGISTSAALQPGRAAQVLHQAERERARRAAGDNAE